MADIGSTISEPGSPHGLRVVFVNQPLASGSLQSGSSLEEDSKCLQQPTDSRRNPIFGAIECPCLRDPAWLDHSNATQPQGRVPAPRMRVAWGRDDTHETHETSIVGVVPSCSSGTPSSSAGPQNLAAPTIASCS